MTGKIIGFPRWRCDGARPVGKGRPPIYEAKMRKELAQDAKTMERELLVEVLRFVDDWRQRHKH